MSRAFKELQGLRVQRDQWDRRVSRAFRVLRGTLGRKEFKDRQELKDPRVQQETRDRRVRVERVPPVLLERGQLDPRDLLRLSRDPRAPRAQVPQDPPGLPVLLAVQDRRATRALPDIPVTLARLEIQDRPVKGEIREVRVIPGPQDLQVPKDRRVQLDQLVTQDLPEQTQRSQDQQDPQAPKDRRVTQDQLEQRRQ